MSSQLETLTKWADITIMSWIEKMDTLRIYDTGNLARSLYRHIETASEGDPIKIQFTYLYYGAFVDMGVGKGHKLGNPEPASEELKGRRAKKWYTKTLERHKLALADIMGMHYSDLFTKPILEAFDEPIKLNL